MSLKDLKFMLRLLSEEMFYQKVNLQWILSCIPIIRNLWVKRYKKLQDNFNKCVSCGYLEKFVMMLILPFATNDIFNVVVLNCLFKRSKFCFKVLKLDFLMNIATFQKTIIIFIHVLFFNCVFQDCNNLCQP